MCRNVNNILSLFQYQLTFIRQSYRIFENVVFTAHTSYCTTCTTQSIYFKLYNILAFLKRLRQSYTTNINSGSYLPSKNWMIWTELPQRDWNPYRYRERRNPKHQTKREQFSLISVSLEFKTSMRFRKRLKLETNKRQKLSGVARIRNSSAM